MEVVGKWRLFDWQARQAFSDRQGPHEVWESDGTCGKEWTFWVSGQTEYMYVCQ